MLETAELQRVIKAVREFVNPGGAVITFQKNAWNVLRSADTSFRSMR